MTRSKSALGIVASLIIAVLILTAGSQGSVVFGGHNNNLDVA